MEDVQENKDEEEGMMDSSGKLIEIVFDSICDKFGSKNIRVLRQCWKTIKGNEKVPKQIYNRVKDTYKSKRFETTELAKQYVDLKLEETSVDQLEKLLRKFS